MDKHPDANDDLWRILASISEWIRFADAKAGAALAVDGVMLVLLAGRLTRVPPPAAYVAVIFSVALALAASSTLAAVWTVVPRMKRLGANAMVHYGTVAAFGTVDEYTSAITQMLSDPAKLSGALSEQIWTLSRAAAHKYKLVGTSIRLLACALAVGLVGLLLG